MLLNWLKRRKGQEQPAQDDADPWTVAKTEEAGRLLVLRFRSRVPTGVDPRSYPHLINIYWRYDGSSTGGMPPSEVSERMLELEGLLDPIEGPGLGFFVVAVTGNSRKEWVWYVSDVQAYMRRLNATLQGQGEPFPIELETNLDPTWAAYTQMLPPTH